jgi:hypothetical protein
VNYLQSLYEGAGTDGVLVTWCKQTGQIKSFATNDLDRAEQHLLNSSQSSDIYFGWCLFEQPPAHGRGRGDAAFFSPGIMFDADIRSADPNVHSQTALPASRDEVFDWLAASDLPEPSQIRSSGNGLYLDWLHDEPVFLRDSDTRNAYAQKVRDFHAHVRASAKALRGWKFDTTHDLARVTRMPGTWNHKTTPAKPVEVLI